MKHAPAVLVLVVFLAGCTEPEQAGERPPAEALQSFDANQPTPFPDAPSPQVREAIRRDALEVRTDRALFQASPMEEATASGSRPSDTGLWAAHRAFPLHSRIRLTHEETGDQVEVRVAGLPAAAPGSSAELVHVIEISPEAGDALGIPVGETAPVWVEIVEWGP